MHILGYRDLGDIEEKILQTITELGAKKGVEHVSSKEVAAICKISNATIFNRFSTMRAALDAAAQRFDRPHMERTVKMAEANLTADQIWDQMLEYFLADPDGTLYYISYTNTFGFDPTVGNPRAEEFLQIARVFFRSEQTLSDNQYLILWDYITSMAFYYAEKFLHSYMDYDEENRAFIKRIVFDGIDRILEVQGAALDTHR